MSRPREYDIADVTEPSENGPVTGDLAGLGPFFAVEFHQRGDEPPQPWLALRALLSDDDALISRVDRVRESLALGAPTGTVDRRVAASVTHLGLVARLIAPAIGAAAVGGPQVSSRITDIWWQDLLGGPYPLSVTTRDSGPAEHPAVDALTTAIGDRFGVSERVLSGNVASAANGAAKMIGLARPDLAENARAAADEILADRRVEGGLLRAGPTFRRRSCCLIYQVAGDRSAVCGDCVLA